jgi:hypothetical protein
MAGLRENSPSVKRIASRSAARIPPQSPEEKSMVKIQSICRRYIARSDVAEMLGAVILLQSTARGFLAKKITVLRKREHDAARRIQRFFLVIKREVDREVKAAKRRRKAKKMSRKTIIEDAEEDVLLENIWRSTVDSMQDATDAVRLPQDAGEKELRSRCVNEKARRRLSRPALSSPSSDKEVSELNKHQFTREEDRARKYLTTGEIMLSMMTPDWVRSAAANYQFRIPPSRATTSSRDEFDQDLCLEEAWIDTEINHTKAYNQKTSKRSEMRPTSKRMEV